MHFYLTMPTFHLWILPDDRGYISIFFSPKSGALMIGSLQENAFFPFVLRAVFLTSEDEKTKGKSRLQIYKKILHHTKKCTDISARAFSFFMDFVSKKASYIPKEKVEKPRFFPYNTVPRHKNFLSV